MRAKAEALRVCEVSSGISAASRALCGLTSAAHPENHRAIALGHITAPGTYNNCDNMKTAVETIFVGRERAYNRRFQQMCSHYLVDPVACTPASGWQKGQVENQVGLTRERFFTPRVRVKSLEELNAWLLDQCIAYARAHRHPDIRDRTIWEMFEAERASLVPYGGRFNGFHAVPASVSNPSSTVPSGK